MSLDYDPATSGPRWQRNVSGHGNAEPRDRPRRVWTDADVAEFNAAQDRAKDAYYAEPFAGTRALNDTDRARERMAAIRAAKKEKP